jgi:hypothetical protein
MNALEFAEMAMLGVALIDMVPNCFVETLSATGVPLTSNRLTRRELRYSFIICRCSSWSFYCALQIALLAAP